jgi:hypothetical protein
MKRGNLQIALRAVVFALAWLGLATVALAQTAFPVQFPPPQGGAFCQGMDLCFDYTKGQGSPGLAFPPGTDTHSAVINAQSSTGGWQSFNANSPVITDLGIQTAPTRTNLVVRSNDQSNAAWVITGGSSVGAPVLSPSGGTDAYPITFAASSAAGLTQNLTGVTASTTYTASLWVRCLSGTELVRIKVWDNTSDKFSSNITVTTAWQRVTFTLTTGATVPTSPNIEIRNASDGLARTVLVYQAQLEAGAFASPPILTSGSAATVNGNQQVINIGASAANGFGLIMQFNALDATAQFKRIVGISDGTGNNGAILYWDTGAGTPLQQVVAGAINQGNVIFPGTNSTGVQTIVIIAGPNYSRGQKIGFAASTTDTTVTWPTGITQLAIGGQGFATTDNMYMQTRRLALRFGPANDAMFNDLVAKATLLQQGQ